MCQPCQILKIRSVIAYRRHDSNEKLRAVRVGTSVRHAESVGSIVLQVGMKFILEFATPDRLTTSAVAWTKNVSMNIVQSYTLRLKIG